VRGDSALERRPHVPVTNGVEEEIEDHGEVGVCIVLGIVRTRGTAVLCIHLIKEAEDRSYVLDFRGILGCESHHKLVHSAAQNVSERQPFHAFLDSANS
jgi:hypothetical protein